jgi:2-polyprenyl-3-methyl-5-hydroxy-6-metoxy-1,4-benzoquinol methylase
MDHLRRFYAHDYAEDVRLTRSPHGRLEFARTVELLGRVLPAPPARVLDVGGGTGIHARWLAEAGYDVTLVDLMGEHVEQAAALEGVVARVGDARSLEAADGSFDVVLLLGPLYHLIEPPDRALALREAVRVARPGAVVAAAAIGRYAGLLDFGAHAGLDEATEPLVRATLETGRHDPRLGFTTAYLHRPEELHAELVAAASPTSRSTASKAPRARRWTPTASTASTSPARGAALRPDRRARPGAARRQRPPARRRADP